MRWQLVACEWQVGKKKEALTKLLSDELTEYRRKGAAAWRYAAGTHFASNSALLIAPDLDRSSRISRTLRRTTACRFGGARMLIAMIFNSLRTESRRS